MNKPYVKMIYDHQLSEFRAIEINDAKLCILRCFLTNEYYCFGKTYDEFIFDESMQEIGGNILQLIKQGNYIVINDTTSQEPDQGPFLYVKIDNFFELLQQWKDFCVTKPTEILITYNANNRIIMTPTFEKSATI